MFNFWCILKSKTKSSIVKGKKGFLERRKSKINTVKDFYLRYSFIKGNDNNIYKNTIKNNGINSINLLDEKKIKIMINVMIIMIMITIYYQLNLILKLLFKNINLN